MSDYDEWNAECLAGIEAIKALKPEGWQNGVKKLLRHMHKLDSAL